MLWYIIWICACIAICGIEFFIYMLAMSKCIKQNVIFHISQSIGQNERKSREQLIEFIDFDSRVKQLRSIAVVLSICIDKNSSIPRRISRFAKHLSDTIEDIFTVFFVWSLTAACGALLSIHTQVVTYGFLFVLIFSNQISNRPSLNAVAPP